MTRNRDRWAFWRGPVPRIIVIAGAVFFLLGNLILSTYQTRRATEQNCKKIDVLDAAIIKLVKTPTDQTMYPVTIVHRDGSRERAIVELRARPNGDDKAATALRGAACNPDNIAP